MLCMQVATPHWYPMLRSRELRQRPVGRMRFGERLVFWRAADGAPVVMPDRCPHRGAALSLGRLRDGDIACPFHGFCFDRNGTCTRTPPEGDRPVPDDLRLQSMPATERHGYIWVWRGAADDPAREGPPPTHDGLAERSYGESVSIWHAHYTRCIENVCDFSHLPFVHRTTIGMFRAETQTNIRLEEIDGGFRAWLLEKDREGQAFEFIYPNLWLLRVQRSLLLSAVFIPVDEHTTEVYGRSYAKLNFPGSRLLLDAWTRLSQYLVFREDWPIVASQQPGDVNLALTEKLLPSDAPIIAYRKMHRAFTRSPGEADS